MTEDLPFGHPAQAPDAATRARVLARVNKTVRRRKARRRVLTTLPVIAVVALVAVAVAGTRQDDPGKDRRTVMAGPYNGPEEQKLAFEPDVPWKTAILSADGETLTITAGTPAHRKRSCQLEVIHDVVETGDSVIVALKDSAPPEDSVRGKVCTRALTPTVVEVHLDRPLGDRMVIDALRSMPPTIYRPSDLVAVTYVPAGFETDLNDVNFGDPVNVQQTYMADGADWYFAINQQKRPFSAPTDGTSEPIMVNGIEGERITGQMNNTMESIRFELDGTFVTVWGEMQGPPTFTHSAELLEIAEAIAPPSSDASLVQPPDNDCLAGFAAPVADLEDQFVGLTVKVAENLAATLDVPFRLIQTAEANGGCLPREDDLRPDRVNAVVDNGKVTAIAMG